MAPASARSAWTPVCPEAEAKQIEGFVAGYIRPLFCEGRGPFRWTCISGDPADLARLDDLALEICKGDHLVERWIGLARKCLPIEALPPVSATWALASASASVWP